MSTDPAAAKAQTKEHKRAWFNADLRWEGEHKHYPNKLHHYNVQALTKLIKRRNNLMGSEIGSSRNRPSG